MNNTHGDLLYRPNTSSSPRPNIMDHIYTGDVQVPSDIGGGHPDPVGAPGVPGPTGILSHSNYQKPRGEVGWICPVCGRGNAPSTAYCNCNMTKPDIVYANGGTTITSTLDDAIPRHTKTNEYTTTAITSSSGANKGSVYGAHFDTHN